MKMNWAKVYRDNPILGEMLFRQFGVKNPTDEDMYRLFGATEYDPDAKREPSVPECTVLGYDPETKTLKIRLVW